MRLSAPNKCLERRRRRYPDRRRPARQLRPIRRGERTKHHSPAVADRPRRTTANTPALRADRCSFSSWRRTRGTSRILQRGDARQFFALEKLQRRSTARRHVRELVFHSRDSRHGVTTTNDRHGALLSRIDQCIRDGARAGVERRCLKHTHGAVPENRLGPQQASAEIVLSRLIDIVNRPPLRDAVGGYGLVFARPLERRRDDGAPWYDHFV